MEYSKTRNIRISLKRGMRGKYLKIHHVFKIIETLTVSFFSYVCSRGNVQLSSEVLLWYPYYTTHGQKVYF